MNFRVFIGVVFMQATSSPKQKVRQRKLTHKKYAALIVAKQNLLQLVVRAKEEHLYFYQKKNKNTHTTRKVVYIRFCLANLLYHSYLRL